ncbi:MAG: hypothetical protein ACI3ZR_07630, partial [bacterium]
FTTNANTFVASTLKLSDEDFNNYVNGAGTLAFADDNSGSIKVNGMKADGYVTLVGKSINVAPGVTMEAKDLSLVAGNNVTFNSPSEGDDGFTELVSYTSNGSNTVTIGGETGGEVTINTKFEFDVIGSKVDINNVNIGDAEDGIWVAAATAMNNNITKDISKKIETETETAEYTTDNKVTINNLTTGANDFLGIDGGKISINGLTSTTNDFAVEAANKFTRVDIRNIDNDENISYDDHAFAGAGNTVELKEVTVNYKDDMPSVNIKGSSVDMDNFKVNAGQGHIAILAGKEMIDKRNNSAYKGEESVRTQVKNTDASNTINIKNSKLKTSDSLSPNVIILGGNINLEGTEINTNEVYLGAGENTAVTRVFEDNGQIEHWFDWKNSLMTKAGNNINIDSSSIINVNTAIPGKGGEVSLVANAVNNQGTISAGEGVNIYAVDGWKYDKTNDTLYLLTSKNNVITNSGNIVVESSDWGSTFCADSLVNTGKINSYKEEKYLTAKGPKNSNCIRISHASDDNPVFDYIHLTVDKPSEDNSSKNNLIDYIDNSNLTPEEKTALKVEITESSQQAANDTKQLNIPASQKLGAVEPAPMTEESAPAVSVEE